MFTGGRPPPSNRPNYPGTCEEFPHRDAHTATTDMILLIDNYDSFVHNLARYLEELGCATSVVRNNAITVDAVRRLAPEAIVISPGPCTPAEAGVSLELIRELGPTIPTLGVCLGHQAIAQALGGNVVRASEPVHGRTSWIDHPGTGVFAGLPNPLRATRYHSLIVEEASLPAALRVTARTADRTVMALEHQTWPVVGVQFHPESILTDAGHRLLANFLKLAAIEVAGIPAGDRPDSPPGAANHTEAWWKTEPLSRELP
jgi:anthranilate synthase/aminodeoxychorismate synthase-like glutamine amidotransferase